MRHSKRFVAAGRLGLMLPTACLLIGYPALALDGNGASDGSYRINESKSAPPASDPTLPPASDPASQTKRLARIDYVSGKITWRPGDDGSWLKATTNQPLLQGAQIWSAEGGRAEIRFDDGSLLRLGNGAVVTLQSLYSDEHGEFTRIKMISGLATLRLTRSSSVYQMDTPGLTVKTNGPARVRIGVDDMVEVGVQQGQATVEGKQGNATLKAGEFLTQNGADAAYVRSSLPAEDSWERWNDSRDAQLYAGNHPYRVYAPAVFAPAPVSQFFFGLSFGSYGHGWYGRGVRWHR